MKSLVTAAFRLNFICMLMYYATFFIRLYAQNRGVAEIRVDEKDFRLGIGNTVFILDLEFQPRHPPSYLKSVAKTCALALLYFVILMTTDYEHFEDLFLLASLAIGVITYVLAIFRLIYKRNQGPEDPDVHATAARHED